VMARSICVRHHIPFHSPFPRSRSEVNTLRTVGALSFLFLYPLLDWWVGMVSVCVVRPDAEAQCPPIGL